MGGGAKLIPSLLAQIVGLLVVFAALLFGGAGTWAWRSARSARNAC
jgi:hypothetical protein